MNTVDLSFVLVSRLKDWCFNPHRPEGIRMRFGSPETIVSVRSANRAGSSQDGYDNLECKASAVLAASQHQADFIAGLAEGRYVVVPGAPVKLPVRVRGEERIDSTGKILVQMSIPFELYPAEVQLLWRTAYDQLKAAQDRFLRLLRWLQDVESPHEFYSSSPSLYWRTPTTPGLEDHRLAIGPEGEYNPAGVDIRGVRGIVWSDSQAAAMQKLLAEGAAEPLAHELLREARVLANTGSRRSALLMAATAVETGVKEHIGRLRPQTSWILQHVPSPPVHKILRDYVREMHASSLLVRDWKALNPLWSACDKLAQARNATTHTGAAVTEATVDRYIEVAADVLYVLDALGGQEWARGRVSSKLRAALGWPGPTEGRVYGVFGSARWEIDKV